MSVSITVYRGIYSQYLNAFLDENNTIPSNGWLNWFWSNPHRVGSEFASTQADRLDGDQTKLGIVARASAKKPFDYGGSARSITGSLDTIETGTGVLYKDKKYLVTNKHILFHFDTITSATTDGLVRRLVCSFTDPKGTDADRPAFQDLKAYLDTQTINWYGTVGNETFVSYASIDLYDLSSGGRDKIVYATHEFGHDTVKGFSADNASRDHDMLIFKACLFADAQAVLDKARQNGFDTIIELNVCSTITLKNVALSSLDASDFAFL